MLKKLKQSIAASTLVEHLINLSRKLVIPGFEGLPLYDVATFFIQAMRKGAITTRASSLAFKFFLALFPGILFLFSLIPYVPIDNFQEAILGQLQNFMPNEAYVLTKSTIEDLVNHRRGGLLSFGFILTLYFASNGINAMISAFNQSYLTIEKRNVIKQRLISFAIIFILTTLLAAAVTLIIFGKMLLAKLVEYDLIQDNSTIQLLQIVKWVVIVLVLYFSFAFIYFMGPSRKIKWRFYSAGCTLTTLLFIMVSLGFAYFVNHFGQYNKLYGSIGSLIVIMLWIYFNSLILLIGFELNASIQNAKQEKLLSDS